MLDGAQRVLLAQQFRVLLRSLGPVLALDCFQHAHGGQVFFLLINLLFLQYLLAQGQFQVLLVAVAQ